MSDIELARNIKEWLGRPAVDPEAITAGLNGTLDREVTRVFPDAPRWFGPATLRAATRKVDRGVCRFCIAQNDAQVHHTQPPTFTAATRVLLGNPCRSCMGRHVNNSGMRPVNARSGIGRRPSSGVSSSGLGRAATQPHALHAPCVTCTQARAAVKAARRGGLTASAAVARDVKLSALVAAALAPHRPITAPTSGHHRLRPVLHNGTGAQENCHCESCRGARIIAYREYAARGDRASR